MTADLKSKKIQLRLTPVERDYLDRLCLKHHMGMSELIRWLVTKEAQKLTK